MFITDITYLLRTISVLIGAYRIIIIFKRTCCTLDFKPLRRVCLQSAEASHTPCRFLQGFLIHSDVVYEDWTSKTLAHLCAHLDFVLHYIRPFSATFATTVNLNVKTLAKILLDFIVIMWRKEFLLLTVYTCLHPHVSAVWAWACLAMSWFLHFDFYARAAVTRQILLNTDIWKKRNLDLLASLKGQVSASLRGIPKTPEPHINRPVIFLFIYSLDSQHAVLIRQRSALQYIDNSICTW